MDYLASQFTLDLAAYLAAIGLLGLLLGWWLGRGSAKRGAKEMATELEQRVSTEQAEHEQTALEVTRLADQLAAANIQLEEARESTSKLRSDLAAAVEQLETERQRVASFEPLLAKRDEALERVRGEHSAAQDRLVALEDEKRQVRFEVESAESQLAAARTRIAELEALVESSQERADGLEDRLRESAIEASEIDRLRQVEEDFQLWQQRAGDRDEELTQSQRALEEASQERDRLVAELADLSGRLGQAELERESHDVAAEAAKRELEAQRQRVRRRDEQIAALETSGAGLSQLEYEVESLRGELSSSVRRVEDLQRQLNVAEAARDEAERARDQTGRELEALLSAPLIDVDRMATVKPAVFESSDVDEASPSPELLEVPHGAADDLQQIRGIGEVLAETLNSLGIYHYNQIAGWSESDIQWVAAHLNTFPDRILRDGWREQAALLDREKQSRQA